MPILRFCVQWLRNREDREPEMDVALQRGSAQQRRNAMQDEARMGNNDAREKVVDDFSTARAFFS
jgi:hypothetical protein